jgi:hypothetical protein
MSHLSTQHGERLRPGPPGGIISDLGSESTRTECDLLSRVPSDDNPVDQVPGAQQARHVLPKDLPKAIMHLTDEELARLLAATITETERRGGVPPLRGEPEPSFSLTRGQMNAVRAAFNAGDYARSHRAAVWLKPIGRAEGANHRPVNLDIS